ncbi:hypothetical protein FW778_12250 [Ginsengibacter hankyongi]|uniref:Uncharacterized protein n=1 Tax=Ginsengibacter hankyongi TaxID=2607284 RepID=A0A5J5IJ72_9BACT|nr:hypothetical protein [Ginsengibacter hankyongi]KAA9039578.1 hypothetical protein FW778_12250 [Ginsengibacter hankyongi]
MKPSLITAITILLLSAQYANVFAQIKNDSVIQHKSIQCLEHNKLLKKSHNQKETATIIGITGGVICLTGIGLAASSLKGLLDPNVHHNDYGSAPDILGIGGSILLIAAIPISLASQANKKKARFYMQKEDVMLTRGINSTELVSIGVRIRLK